MRLICLMCFVFMCNLICFGDSFSIYLENDLLHDTDSFYTHGTRISFSKNDEVEYVIGQHLYTPTDITVEKLILGDRPYAGWLYVGFLLKEIEDWIIECTIGVIGPSACGEEIQTFVHEMVDSETPKGWDNQIDDEFVFQTLWEKYFNIVNKNNFSIKPYGCFAGGNVFMYIGGGVNVMFGKNVPKTILNSDITMSVSKKSYFYGFMGAECRNVFRNSFLDTLINDNTIVEKENIVSDLKYGISIGNDKFSIDITQIHRSKEFVEQIKPETFNSLKFSWHF